MSEWTDTLMNIEVFAFIGFLIWLALKPTKTDANGDLSQDNGRLGQCTKRP